MTKYLLQLILNHGEVLEIQKPEPKGNLVPIQYNNYFMINVEVLERLVQEQELTKSEKMYIMEMSGLLRTPYNALYTKNQRPHNSETLSKVIELSHDRTIRLLKILEKKGIVAKMTCAGKVMYCMNPFLARRRQFVDKELAAYFNTYE